MPLGYGYLTHHLPRKVTHTRTRDSATKQVQTHETRGKKMQLYNPALKCLVPSGREKHTHASDELFLQVQTSVGGAATPLATFPPSAGPGPASDGDTGGRTSTPREDASTALGLSRPGSPQGFRPEQTPRLAAPLPQPAVPRGPQPGSRPRRRDSGIGPARGRPGQAPATTAAPPRPGKPHAPGPTKPLFEPTPPLSTSTLLPPVPAHRRAVEGSKTKQERP
jgi:hypothetical protein